MLNPENIHRLQ